MDTLPVEVLEEITQHLTTAELATCGTVCRRWRELFNNDSLWNPRCNAALEETLRTTPCVVEPPFVSPEEVDSTLSPIGQWRLAYMREARLWKNWRQGNYKVDSNNNMLIPNTSICHTFFVSNDLVVRLFDENNIFSGGVQDSIKLYDVKDFPPTLLKEITNVHGGWFKGYYYLNNKFIMYYKDYSMVYNLDLNTESILDFKFKVCLPVQEFPDGSSTAPRFALTQTAILGYNPITYHSSETLHIWDLEEGTELKVEKSPIDKPYGFTDVITSTTSDSAIIVVSNDVNCESFVLCAHFDPREEIMITYHFHVYNAGELKFLPFVEVFEAEHRIRYKCKTHLDYVAIAINGVLKIYNYRSHHILTEVPVKTENLGNTLQTTFLDVVDDCFAFIVDCTFKMFHPTSRAFIALVDLHVTQFSVISDSMVRFKRVKASTEIWRVGRHCQQRLCEDHISEGKINECSTRALKEDPSYISNVWKVKGVFHREFLSISIRAGLKCPRLTEWFYYW